MCNMCAALRRTYARDELNTTFGPLLDIEWRPRMSAFGGIVLQKSKVAGLRIFRENTKREAIANSYNLNRATEVAYEFNVRR